MLDDNLLFREAFRFVENFLKEEETCCFWLGVSNGESNRAFFLTVQAARRLCGAQEPLAHKLLKMAIDDLEKSSADGTLTNSVL